MAQAARLNLRMQKELKLLLTNPPPLASFPLISGADSNLSSSSLSTIDAQIEGPEGTVYAKGIFHIKIQIPERYPFQPPSVTFVTPIYHPNIDNGGRICLDILNLPPKGAWQPSLNISTVLTSIGLLLSEPNPDDGLMCEASREYKYNRIAFDQKARSMTEKYAKAGASGSSSSSQSILTNSNPSMVQMEIQGLDKESKYEGNDYTASHKKLRGISRKLSLESSGSTLKTEVDGEVNGVPNCHLLLSNFENQMENQGPKRESEASVDEYNLSHEKQRRTRCKLSLQSLGESRKKDGDDKENAFPNRLSSVLNTQSLSMVSLGSSSLLQAKNCYEQQLHPDGDSKSITQAIETSSEKLCEDGQKLLLEPLDTSQASDGNNMQSRVLPMPQFVNQTQLHPQMDPIDRMGNGFTNINCKKLSLYGKKLSLGFKGSSQRQEKDNKENEVPAFNLPLPQTQSLSKASFMPSLTSQAGENYDQRAGNCGTNASPKKCGICQKLSPEPLSQLQGRNGDSSNLLSQSLDLSTAPSKSLPVPYYCSCDGKQQSNQDHDEKIGIKQQRREESPICEAVIVLDSEDSEDEKTGYSRSKLVLERKRLAGKWRTKV